MKKLRILFATIPADSHFGPLTSLAVHLSDLGHDVRWYVGGHYREKVTRLGLYHYPFVKARTVNRDNLDALFPERAGIRGTMARLRFDLREVYLLRVPEFVEDLKDIYADWTYDLVVHDAGFLGSDFIREILPVKTVSVGIAPLAESDTCLPPSGLGKQPARSRPGRWIHHLMRYFVQQVQLKPIHDLYNQLRRQHNLPEADEFVFDAAIRHADLYLQSGVPSLEYPRRSISPNIRFVGAMLPCTIRRRKYFEHAMQALQARRVVLVTQGTVEKDIEKLLVPTLRAFKNEPSTLVIATTGGSCTEELRKRFPEDNFIIEDYIDFDTVMPYASVLVTNGGYGGVMQALKHNLPLVVAGVQEGRNEVAARIEYCKAGINLKTETPRTVHIWQAIDQVLTDSTYQRNARKLGWEFGAYDANELATQYIEALAEVQERVLLAEELQIAC
ncbi:glycosyltransferase [Telluribacter sp. SYSU D00476]|uniref:glycosyltransferase n=1 Tax=Telluribacter sp. SYSU D00476 TaxID=2811430 RepID=UPI001FF19D9D|nr:nucleotide disphospho-sugar-binding domain-containing protein [Telluribacter sp. SYSU D00476]